MKSLKEYRNEITAIDQRLIPLLEERLSVACQIGKLKKEQGLPIQNPEREAEVLEYTANQVSDELYRSHVVSMMSEIIRVSREFQEKA